MPNTDSPGTVRSWRLLSLLPALLFVAGCDQPAVGPSTGAPPAAPAVQAQEEQMAPAGQSEPEIEEADEAGSTAEEQQATAAAQESDDADASSEPTDTSGRYEFRENHDPNGIGKFYMGREIAWVMGFAAAPWLERPEREKEEATSLLIKSLALKPGMTVADIGAGSGVLTLPMAAQVGDTGKVIAVDVQPEMLDLLRGKLRSREIENVELVQGTEKSPRLKKESVDLALMVDVYHEFAFPYEMMLGLSQAMKPGGRVVFVEFRLEDESVPIKLVHKMSEAQVKKEIALPEFGLKWKETIEVLPWQHIIIFERQPASTPSKKEKQGAASEAP